MISWCVATEIMDLGSLVSLQPSVNKLARVEAVAHVDNQDYD